MGHLQGQKTFKSGEIMMHQGDTGACAYIIETGRVEIIIRQGQGPERSVGTRGPGAMIGEMSIIDNAPRTATVRAIEDCTLLEITSEEFAGRLENADPILKMTIQVILTRYRDMLTRADISGENRNRPPPEMVELNYTEGTDAYENIRIANDFKSALNTDELRLHYQPIVNLQTGELAGFEALMRWEHPTKGPISPGIFIPVIEETGLIVKASRWALQESLMALKRIENRAGYRDNSLFMSVNFSSHDLASENFIDSVYTTISESDVNPRQVHLEITERLLMHQPDNAKDTLDMCRKAGMSIAIDDFGTGYSSLSYLHYFPIDTLKIDQSFVRDMTKNDASMTLVKSIVELAKNMGMKTIAEGVEEKSEATALKNLGCEMAQGYYLARPIPERDVTELARSREKADI